MLAVAAVVLPGTSAVALPVYEGTMSFPAIADPAGTEDYSWEVDLAEDQALRSVDDRHAEVYYVDAPEHVAFGVEAGRAHDANGANVPTTLAIPGGNVITLTVHHRAGDPATGGQPFDYPVVAGEGWIKVGPGIIVVAPLEENVQETLQRIRDANTATNARVQCVVPMLRGLSLRAAKRRLSGSECRVGDVRKIKATKTRAGRVVRQYPRPGVRREGATGVDIVLAQ
jgi:hypothetical protein